jgi:heptosyltransferase-1
MPAQRVLFVKLSSLGDVVHHLPAVTDLARARPDARIAWAVEEAYAGLVKLHPAVCEPIPVGLRALRRAPFSGAAWGRFGAARRTLRESPWDYVVDTQGLLKSAFVVRMARGPSFGQDRASAREPLAARFYDVKLRIERGVHAVERNRRLVAAVFGYPLDSAAHYGLAPPPSPPAWAPSARYVVLLHAASHAAKRWPEDRWIALGNALAREGHAMVLPGGTDEERAIAARIAKAIPGALAAPAMDLVEAAALLGNAGGVVGVDTGLTHLAVALGVPTVGIYCATNPALTGLHGGADAVNTGGAGAPPSVDEVLQAIGAGANAP